MCSYLVDICLLFIVNNTKRSEMCPQIYVFSVQKYVQNMEINIVVYYGDKIVVYHYKHYHYNNIDDLVPSVSTEPTPIRVRLFFSGWIVYVTNLNISHFQRFTHHVKCQIGVRHELMPLNLVAPADGVRARTGSRALSVSRVVDSSCTGFVS